MISNNLNATRAGSVRPLPALSKPVTAPVDEPQERFVGSDMAQTLARVEKPVAEPPRPEPHGEMALMLENIQRAEEAYACADLTGLKAAATNQGSNPTTLLMLEEAPEPPHAHPKQHDKELGTHLGLEVGEQLIHKASHGASHVAEAANHGAELAHHGAAVAHHATHQTTASSAQVVQSAGHGAAEISATLATAAGIGAAGCGALGVVMLHTGIQEIKAGLKDKNAEHTLEGVGNTIVGVRSGLAGVTLAGMLAHGSEVLTTVAAGAQVLLAPLGVAHGAIDIGLGTKDIVQGVRQKDQPKIVKGALSVGLGGALTAAALGGGIPALVVAGVFLGGKVVQGIRRKHAGAEQAQENNSKAS